MCSFLKPWLVAAAVLLSLDAAAQSSFPGIGRSATAAELKAWDTDVRPDFKGLPTGSGTVAAGMLVWEAQCAACHGYFGESNEVFTPLVGGTTAQDIQSGHVARLNDPGYPGRSTLMKLATLSTLWDTIYRAMPWNKPRSLSVDEVYAVTAYLLHLGGVLTEDATLSHTNIAQVQQRLPNRNGMGSPHALWPGGELGNELGNELGGESAKLTPPDDKAKACMKDCADAPQVASKLPEHARDAHGDLAQQQRLVGAQRGAASLRVPDAVVVAADADGPAPSLANKHQCLSCHGIERKIVGPALHDVAKKYAGRSDAVSYLAQKIQYGGSGVWGPVAMPAQSLPAADAQAIARWLAATPTRR